MMTGTGDMITIVRWDLYGRHSSSISGSWSYQANDSPFLGVEPMGQVLAGGRGLYSLSLLIID